MELHEASAKERGEGVLFQRIRRITGYLVGTLDRFNNAKRAEERDRVKHGMGHIRISQPGHIHAPAGSIRQLGRLLTDV